MNNFENNIFCMSNAEKKEESLKSVPIIKPEDVIPGIMDHKFKGIWYEFNVCHDGTVMIRTDYYDPERMRQVIMEKVPATWGIRVIEI